MKLGLVLGAALDFLIVAALVFAFAKWVLQESTPVKK
jgi:large-conductance mechanosensitive channel